MASSIYSAAGNALNLSGGFGGATLTQQVQDETEEDKRKRRFGLSAMQSPAGQALLQSPFAK
jgi:hypothetical protein